MASFAVFSTPNDTNNNNNDSSFWTVKKPESKKSIFDPTRLESHASFLTKMFQLVPLFIIYPTWQLTRIFLFFQTLLFFLNEVPGPKNVWKFVATLVTFHLFWVTVAPLLFIVCKWLIIGKYQKGRYPLWGDYYLRWWFVDVLRKMVRTVTTIRIHI